MIGVNGKSDSDSQPFLVRNPWYVGGGSVMTLSGGGGDHIVRCPCIHQIYPYFIIIIIILIVITMSGLFIIKTVDDTL